MAESEKQSVKSRNGGKREGAGRKKGVPNKLSTTVKENVIAVFEEIGGVDNMAKWAKEHPGHFYNLYAKLMPIDTNVNVAGTFNFKQILVNGVKAGG